MNEEALDILRALKAGQELLIAKVDGIDIRLAKLEGYCRLDGLKQKS
ncbi:hypothetical protein [Cohnella sp.]